MDELESSPYIPFQQPLEMGAHLIEKQVGALRIADEQMKLVVVAVDQKAVAAIGEIEPRGGCAVADEVDHLRPLQEENVAPHNLQRSDFRQPGKMPRTIGRPLGRSIASPKHSRPL